MASRWKKGQAVRILHLINSLGTGGAEMLVVDLADAMRAHGHTVRVACLSPVDGVPNDKARSLGLDVTMLGAHRYDPRAALSLIDVAKGADVVHAHLFPASYWAAISPLRPPVLFTEHSTWNRRRESPFLRVVDKAIYRQFDRMVAISDGTAASLAHHLGVGVESVPIVLNGISNGLVAGPAAPREKGQRIILVASLENRRKDITRAVRAVGELQMATLTVVGEGPDRAEIEGLIASLGLQDRIHLLGRRSDVPELLREHDLFLSTSRVEGFGLAAAEGMAVGLPVVAPDIPGISEVVSHNVSGLLFDPVDETEPVRSINRVMGDPALGDRLATQGRLRARQFTIDTCATNYERHYAELIAQAR